MKERPILFSGPMVRAIRDGSKTQTRRVVTLGRTGTFGHSGTKAYDYHFRGTRRGGARGAGSGCWQDLRLAALLKLCPFGVPGDRLWGRETWASAQKHLVAYRADGECGAWIGDSAGGKVWNRHGGIADREFHVLRDEHWRGATFGLDRWGGRWRPSIHMPRWASRITLEVTNVRVQRLQEISEEDARAEGLDWASVQCFSRRDVDDGDREDPREVGYGSGSFARDNFRRLWNSINAKRGHGWDANPWVWAITFAKVTA